MPLTGQSISEDISEFHQGPTYAKTRARFGKERANKQAIAVAYSAQRSEKGRTKKLRMRRPK